MGCDSLALWRWQNVTAPGRMLQRFMSMMLVSTALCSKKSNTGKDNGHSERTLKRLALGVILKE